MPNKTITIAKLLPPTQDGGWARVVDSEQVEYSIAPDKWEGVKNDIKVGEGTYNVYPSKSGKLYLEAAKKAPSFVGGGKPKDTSGVAIGAALNNAVTLVSSGKVDIKDLKATAKRILDISIELKKEYEGKL